MLNTRIGSLMEQERIQALLNRYYADKLKLHGPNYKGADWGSLEAQQISFEQLIKLLPSGNFSLLDFGCGYGALYDYLMQRQVSVDYSGFDISPEMIDFAALLHAKQRAHWFKELPVDSQFDYVIACGIFSIKLDVPIPEWENHTFETLKQINAKSKKGFAFNSLTAYSDADKMKDYLYYPDPCRLFDFCKRNFSPYVTLLHDYPKYEFTIIVRKEL